MFTVAAVVTLALGIRGNTAILTVINTVLLKPLDYPEPGRLLHVSVDNTRRGLADSSFSLARSGNRAFRGLDQ